jgi:hypothetical protein
VGPDSVHRGLVQPEQCTTGLDEVTKDVLDLVRVLDDRESLQFCLAELHFILGAALRANERIDLIDSCQQRRQGAAPTSDKIDFLGG